MSVLIELYTNIYAAPYAHLHSCINVRILLSVLISITFPTALCKITNVA